jgi:hypothetical protein
MIGASNHFEVAIATVGDVVRALFRRGTGDGRRCADRSSGDAVAGRGLQANGALVSSRRWHGTERRTLHLARRVAMAASPAHRRLLVKPSLRPETAWHTRHYAGIHHERSIAWHCTGYLRLLCLLDTGHPRLVGQRCRAANVDRPRGRRRTSPGPPLFLLDAHMSALSGGAALRRRHCAPRHAWLVVHSHELTADAGRCRHATWRWPSPWDRTPAVFPPFSSVGAWRSVSTGRKPPARPWKKPCSRVARPRARENGGAHPGEDDTVGARHRSANVWQDDARAVVVAGIYPGHRQSRCVQSLRLLSFSSSCFRC